MPRVIERGRALMRTATREIKSLTRPKAPKEAEPMYKQANGLPYKRFLRRLHTEIPLDWYMEVGCRSGKSLQEVRGKTIAVDPFFRVDSNVIKGKPAAFFFQQTSDDFFDSGLLKQMGVNLSLSFLDGMHLFEYLLRDFINTEKLSDSNGAILMHDCCPYSEIMTTRDLKNLPKGAWTGDVWKIIPILQEHRPDLKIDVLDCAPTGLVAVSNLDPKSRKLSTRYDRIVEEWTPVGIEDYGPDRFYGGFDYVSARQVSRDGFPFLSDKVRLSAQPDAPEYVTP